jgi:alanine dehydrogenase
MYRAAGAGISADINALYESARLIVKVKEPVEPELSLLRSDHLLFSYLHLAANPELTKRLLDIGLTAIGFETVQSDDGQLPLLTPMSDIAGRIAVQTAATLLYHHHGGKGILLGGLPAAERGRVVILGGGVAGGNAAVVAASLGAEVVVFDRNRLKLERMRALGGNVTALYPYNDLIEREVCKADVLVGAVLIAGEKAPHLVSADMVRQMSPGSVIIDIAVDQGGCIETTRPTTYADPTFMWENVIHYGVTNMPGAVPRSASQALSASLMPCLMTLAETDWQKNKALNRGVNVSDGQLIHPALKKYVA